MQVIYEHASASRKVEFPAGPDVYRSKRYQRLDDIRHFHLISVDETDQWNEENYTHEPVKSAQPQVEDVLKCRPK